MPRIQAVPDFSMDTLSSALQHLMVEQDEGAVTTAEIKSALGITEKTVYKLLDELGDRVEVVKKRVRDRTGVARLRPAYRLSDGALIDEVEL